MPNPGDSADLLNFNPQPQEDPIDPLVTEAMKLIFDPFYAPKRLYEENQETFDKPIKAAGDMLKSGYDKTKEQIERTYDATIDQLAERPLTSLLEGPYFAILHGLVSRDAKDQQKLVDNARNLLQGTSDGGSDFRQRAKDIESIRLGKDGKATPEWKSAIGQIRNEQKLARDIETQLTSANLDDLKAIVANNTTDGLKRVAPKVQKALDIYHTDIDVSVSERGRLIVKEKGSEYQLEITSKSAEVTHNGRPTDTLYFPDAVLKAYSNRIIERVKEEQETSEKDRLLKPVDAKAAKPQEVKAPDAKPQEVKGPDKAPAATANDAKPSEVKDAKAKEVANKPEANKDWKQEELAKLRSELKEQLKRDAQEYLKEEKAKLRHEREELQKQRADEKKFFDTEWAKINTEKQALESLRAQIAKEREALDARNTPVKTVEPTHYSGRYYVTRDQNGNEQHIPVESEAAKEYLRNYSRIQQPQCRTQHCGN